MLTLTKSLLDEPEFKRLIAGIEAGACPAVISGLSEIHRAHAAAAVRAATMRPVAVICADEDETARLARDIAALTMEQAFTLIAREFTFHSAEVVSRQIEQRRISTLAALAENKAPIVVMSANGALQRTISPERLAKASLTLKMGGTHDLNKIAETLVLCGYSRSEQVEGTGQFSLRGGILDFFSPLYDEPVRCEFFGDEIESMGFFDILTQRRTEQLGQAQIAPVAETLPSLYAGFEEAGARGLAGELEKLRDRLEKQKHVNPALINNIAADIDRLKDGRTFPAADRYMELIYPMATALDYLREDTILMICEPLRVKERAEGFLKLLSVDCVALLEAGILESSLVRFAEDWVGFTSRITYYPVLMADSFTGSSYPLRPRTMLNISTKRLPSYGGSMETAASDIAHYKESGFRTVIVCQDKRRAGHLREYLEERGISTSLDYALQSLPDNGHCTIAEGDLSAGMEYPGIKLAVITEGQIIAQPITRRARKTRDKTNRERIQSFSDLSPGDLVVHDQHGIGRFVGFFKMPVDGVQKDYIKIAYAGSDSLYVPATQLDMVAKYIGGGADSTSEDGAARGIRLSKLGGADWSKVKSRAKTAAKEMARELIKLYAERQRLKGHAFAPDSLWQTEFEEKFGYQETDDQLKCAQEIKTDMEKAVPMDRLLCGDVGYGKTEIAFRAIMKCVLDGYQAAILVPTTVLAQQHYVTSMRRFAGYPVNIEVLSRFRSPAQIKRALRDVENGGVDFIIGTHRILQKDVKFKKLGLLVVDEEQRFGVSHKERLKEMSKQVDVLTLSATPIPRTMNMALSGIRDMSTIEEPPQSRRPVLTYVLEHDWGILCDAIRREISRGGQVYYLHNRIENIERVTARLSEMLEGINIAVAHGKMDEDSLSDVMERMFAGEIQVLVCTTIIESGIDIPNVNTLIVEDADRLGLAQLHQIRGRVGRSPRRAYAYLTFRRGKLLSEIAEKRLSAINEFAEFNSGFKIAMRDLEIRGAGSLLGAEQSGHMMSVGYDMYLKLLEEAVLEEKGEKPPQKAECPADLNVSAGIPEKYIPSGQQRMDLYRRIALIRTEEDSNDILTELIDRYGDPPPQVISLTTIAMLRCEAAVAGITEISQKDGWLQLKLSDFNMESISRLYDTPEYTGRVRVVAGTAPAIALKIKGSAVLDEAVRFVRAYKTFGASQK
ncbi:MAG: transcription-repair coupling factor [Oscillospiraceae bacterium]|nr:transcription-repair coupling factor [Oscillospiraceae bacterium]